MKSLQNVVWKGAVLLALLSVAGCFASPNQKKVDAAAMDAAGTSDSAAVDADNGDTPVAPLGGNGDATDVSAADSADATDSMGATDTIAASPDRNETTPSGARQGEACSPALACAQGTCVDGLCCDKPCTDACYSCKKTETGKADGTCAPALVGTNPKGICKLDTANPCGELAACDGAGACSQAPSTKPCKAAGCESGYWNAAATCDGAGKCPVTTKACGAYACETAGCKTSCASDAECTGTNRCDLTKKVCAVPPACVPKARDCTSTADNNCDGTPDNQESACACKVDEVQACQTHPGKDGKGICKAGSRTCVASSDKTSSAWGACSGSVGPSAEICDAAGVDENCDGQSNEGCQCVNGTTNNPCGICGGVATCTNGVLGPCSKTTSIFYRDADQDGDGTPSDTITACSVPIGYASTKTDCDDSRPDIKLGLSACSGLTRLYCDGGGTPKSEPCSQGCLGGQCRHDGTIGVPGKVTCGPNSLVCNAGDGCFKDPTNPGSEAVCGSNGDLFYAMHCDGPSDCDIGQVCCLHTMYISSTYACAVGTCPAPSGRDYYTQVCDPLAPQCPAGTRCEAGASLNDPYLCTTN